MKKLQNLCMCLALMCIVFSCKKTDTTPVPQANTIANVIENSASFSLLRQALVKANLLDAVRNTPNITVFAPDNMAFTSSNIDASTINNMSVTNLSSILSYHVLKVSVKASNIPASDTLPTLTNKYIFASNNANGLFINGIRAKQADITVSNGTMYVINRVLAPPVNTIAEIVVNDTSLTLLVAAVQKANLSDTMKARGKYTILAPSNAAFRKAGYPNTTAITNASQATINKLVRYHILRTHVFISDFIHNSSVTSLQGNLQVSANPGVSLKITGSTGESAGIYAGNILATNGVIHVINKVLQ